MNNLIALHCPVHGAYQKFKNQINQGCPFCAKAKADGTLQSVFAKIELVKITVGCADHGFTENMVPKSVAQKFDGKCTACDRKDSPIAKDAVGARFRDECKKANIPSNTFGKTFAGLDVGKSERQPLIVNALITEVKHLINAKTATGAKNILLTGNKGAGKTALASIFLQNVILRATKFVGPDADDVIYQNTLRCRMLTESDLVLQIKATWAKTSVESQKDLIESLCRIPVLCIDDIGSNEATTHLFDAYHTIFDERYKRRLPTILTSNVAHTDLEKIIGTRAADRFLESERCIVMQCNWAGYRRDKGITII